MVDYRDTRCMGKEACAPDVPHPCASDKCITMVECTQATMCAHLKGWIVFSISAFVFLLVASNIYGPWDEATIQT